MPYDAVFDGRSVEPRQGGGPHPVGNKYPFRITNTTVEAVKVEQGQAPKGGKFVVEFTSPAGSIKENYNLWNESDMARKIASQELSALCHATGVFTVDFKNDGAALRGAEGLMDIGFQKGHEPSAEKPEGGYVELKKVYDRNGNEPGKAPQTAQPQQPQGQPAVSTGFNPQPSQNNAPAPQAGGSWGGPAPATEQPKTTVPNGPSWGQPAAGEPNSRPPWS